MKSEIRALFWRIAFIVTYSLFAIYFAKKKFSKRGGGGEVLLPPLFDLTDIFC